MDMNVPKVDPCPNCPKDTVCRTPLCGRLKAKIAIKDAVTKEGPLPTQDSDLPDTQQGLYQKYHVVRTDGSSAPGGKHANCEYFVLDMNHDPHAKPALAAYAASCFVAGYEELARDLITRYDL